MSVGKLVVFLGVSVGLVAVSRASLRTWGSHGFFRFFAWEVLLALTLLNMDAWFRTPLAWHQLISWPLLAASGFLAVHGAQLLRSKGRPTPHRHDATLIAFEKTTVLVTTGAYRFIRHPLYSSLLFLAWGIFFKAPSWPGVLLAVAASGFLVATAHAEEAENLCFFGAAYEAYRKRTRMFIPFVF